jgi:signal transduction histidine kinase/ActR/RegA family two-component response regulator
MVAVGKSRMRQDKKPAKRPPTRLTLDALPMPAVIVDERHAVLEANRQFTRLLARKRSPVGRTLRELMDAAGMTAADTALGKVFVIDDEGLERSFRLTLRARGRGALAVFSDVTEARLASHRPRLAQEVREQLMHDAEIGLWCYDPDAQVYHFGSELSLGHGDVAAAVPLQTLLQVQHRDDRAADEAIRERLTREGGVAETETRYLAAAGDWIHLRVLYRSGERLPSGRYEMYGLSQSITALAKARDEANASAQRLNLALKSSRAGVFEYDYKTRAFWVSSEFSRLVGAESLTPAAEDPTVLFAPEDRPAVRALRERAAAGAGAEPIDVRLQRPDGEIWTRLFLEVEMGPDGRPRRGVGLLLDIDEAKRQELAVTEARRAAEAATLAKSDFLASVSHEIRTPMNGIVGVLNLLRRETLSEQGAQLLEEALGCTQMLSQLINDVLDLSKIEAGKLDLAPAPTDVRALAEGVVNLVRPQAQAKGVALTLRIAPDAGWALIDPVRLRQCFFNIIGNAVKFTSEGGVEVRVTVRGEAEAARLRCEVADTGVGIPESARDRLFGRFEQVDAGATRRFGGTGLGLAITRQLVRMMGGDLDYESREGEGSTFWFEIAAPVAAMAAPQAEDAAAGAPLAGLRVLVVDDNRVNRLIGVKTLEAMGASAEAVESGPAAIEAVSHAAFDFVLMDVNMPDMDGLEATRRIRALGPRGQALPIIALTADVMRHQREACLAAGMNEVAAKPFSPSQLLGAILSLAPTEPPSAQRTA